MKKTTRNDREERRSREKLQLEKIFNEEEKKRSNAIRK